MKLASFTIKNFRSITEASKIRLEASTVLIGPNNEGKSNILRALALAMNVITGRRERGGTVRARREGWYFSYNPELDVPVGGKRRVTSVELEFALSDAEIADFKTEVSSSLNGTLPIVIRFEAEGPSINIPKPGRGNVSLNGKRARVLRFLASRIQFHYIPAVRTAASSADIVEQIVSSALLELEDNPEYQEAVQKIRTFQQPVLEAISKGATKTLKRFVPAINDVKFSVDDERRYSELRRSIDISVDDGTITPLAQKGDGIQSLIALGIRHHAYESARKDQNYIFAIEEPEAHLHSSAIHELRRVLDDISINDQVIISTHSPVFANRNNLKCNIIVNKNKASVAKKIQDVRDVLGVRAYENLVSAEQVLLVEGFEDKFVLEPWLKKSMQIKHAIDGGRLIIVELSGASKLAQLTQLYKSLLCGVHAFLDCDEEGIRAGGVACKASLLLDKDVGYAKFSGLDESELEDFVDPKVYTQALLDKYGVDFSAARVRVKKQKWSRRLKDAFEVAGRGYSDNILADSKRIVAESVAASASPFHLQGTSVLEQLRLDIEEKLSDA
ncbi:MAG: AAA family ATPase [Beijerinckiaceae bacterium]|nr:AAA family ATPase [Beijerinckiaceae bacterium]